MGAASPCIPACTCKAAVYHISDPIRRRWARIPGANHTRKLLPGPFQKILSLGYTSLKDDDTVLYPTP
jgi:hypothetical protein